MSPSSSEATVEPGTSRLAALDELHDACRTNPEPDRLDQLTRLRLEAFDDLDRTPGRREWPPPADDPLPGLGGIPEIDATDLDAQVLAGAVSHHGALLVRGLISPSWQERLVTDIDRAIEGYDAWKAGAPADQTAPWFVPRGAGNGGEAIQKMSPFGRKWVRTGGGAWLVDSPQALFDVLEAYDQAGLRTTITEYLGERPALSVQKSTLRRVPLDLDGADWHQDGAFLSPGIRTINVWLSLTDCGVVAPGMDIVPRRLPGILETGTRGASFDWSVGQGIVDDLHASTPVRRPHFLPGDALLFDELNLHRTALSADMVHERYAVESWFFAPSCYPADQIAVVY